LIKYFTQFLLLRVCNEHLLVRWKGTILAGSQPKLEREVLSINTTFILPFSEQTLFDGVGKLMPVFWFHWKAPRSNRKGSVIVTQTLRDYSQSSAFKEHNVTCVHTVMCNAFIRASNGMYNERNHWQH